MKPMQSRRLAFAALLSLSFFSASCHVATEHWGWIEQSQLMPEHIQAKARLDTGMLTSPLDARNVHRYKKNGECWVCSDVMPSTVDSEAPVSMAFEHKVLWLIKVYGTDGSDSRPVAAMDICLGAELLCEQFSLHDHGSMNYLMLSDRRTFGHLGAVDVSRTFTRKPTCGALAAQQRNPRGSPAVSVSRNSTISVVIHRSCGYVSSS